MPSPTGHPLLLGRFYPEYDIAVGIIWLFIILAGIGNWVVIWCILKTKSLRNPFNMIVIALAFSNGVTTTLVGPMDLARILMSYKAVTTNWCNTRVLLKSFSFSISMLIIFSLSVMRLTAGLVKTPTKMSYKKIGATIATIYGIAIVTSPVMLDKRSSTYQVCLGDANDILRRILENDDSATPEVPIEPVNTSISNEDQVVDFSHGYNQFATISVNYDSKTTSKTFNMSFVEDEGLILGNSPMQLWVYYLIVTMALFIGTIICYIGLIIILKRHKHTRNGMVLGNSKDILTMRVTAYVTCSFFISFLAPFFPALVRLSPQNTPAKLHYISIFHCLSSLDAALTPLVYYFSNVGYRNALLKALPRGMIRAFCRRTQVAAINTSNNPRSISNATPNVAFTSKLSVSHGSSRNAGPGLSLSDM